MQQLFPGGPIPSDLFEAMVKEYHEKRLTLIKDQLGIDDARKCWFSKKTIDELFKAAGATEENSEHFGLEIHYGVVPEDRKGVPIPDDYVGLHNLILVATKPAGVSGLDDDDDGKGYDTGTLCPPNCH
ncbi:hypothetical protein [Desertivirga xinjiangensis]|uniref:hypothetical protein n=1 Tax=Desertivirga xinjiangensis TaxID=539206 RepID=UPI00210870DE|nr:hypothetical protein [Pedobacter xinjiangensis]